MSGKKSRSNKTQIRLLIDFMSANNHLALGEFSGPLGSKRAEVQWVKLKNLLKSYGPDRTIEQWKQTWKDLKKNARHEYAVSALALNGTEKISTFPILSDISKKVLDTIGHESSIGIGPAESAMDPISVCDKSKMVICDSEDYETQSQISHNKKCNDDQSNGESQSEKSDQYDDYDCSHNGDIPPTEVTLEEEKKEKRIKRLLCNSSTQTYEYPADNKKKLELANEAFGLFIGHELGALPKSKRRFVMNQIIKLFENNS